MKLSIVAVVAYAGLAYCQISNYTSHLLLCEDVNLTGRCITFPYLTSENQCINVPSFFNDLASSVAPEGSGHNCTLYQDYGCTGSTHQVTSYVAFLYDFNDIVSSFQCSS